MDYDKVLSKELLVERTLLLLCLIEIAKRLAWLHIEVCMCTFCTDFSQAYSIYTFENRELRTNLLSYGYILIRRDLVAQNKLTLNVSRKGSIRNLCSSHYWWNKYSFWRNYVNSL